MSLIKNLNPYELHKHLINEYVLTNKGSTKCIKARDASKDKRDIDVIRENHRFLWDDGPVDSWEKGLAKRYYDKLFKEYCICDLSKYKENKVALRWRTESEVISGSGQFTCGNKKCPMKEGLKSWEVNFAYVEENEKKNALVKLRLCTDCSAKLNYHTKKKEVKRMKKSSKHKHDGSKAREDEPTSSSVSEASHVPGSTPPHSKSSTSRPEPPSEPWKKTNEPEEKSREEEFESYLEDLLL